MLQIIGWMGCFYLLVKGVEIFQRTRPQGDEKTQTIAAFAFVACIIAAIVFVMLINAQAASTPSLPSLPSFQ